MDYTSQVRQFGGAKWNINKDGDKINLSHRESFCPGDVKTDGAGNVTAMPFLRRKPCFGRPERRIRADIEAGMFTDREGRKHHTGRCARCPVAAACATITNERVQSSPTIQAALNAFLDKVGKHSGKGVFYLARREWGAFLGAIERHGGWTNVNDRQVEAAAIADRAKLAGKKRKQRAARKARERNPVAPAITPEFLEALDAGHDERLNWLLDVRQRKVGPRWLKHLSDDRCRLHAEVWRARELLARQGRTAPTLKEVVAALREPCEPVSAGSFLTIVARASKRIQGLKDHAGEDSVWSKKVLKLRC